MLGSGTSSVGVDRAGNGLEWGWEWQGHAYGGLVVAGSGDGGGGSGRQGTAGAELGGGGRLLEL